MFIIPIIFITLSQPFTLSIIMTVQTVFSRLFIYFYTKHVWMSLTLILVIVGGLMISFVYVRSLIPAEPYTRTFIWITPVVVIPFIVLFLNFINYKFYKFRLEFVPNSIFNSATYWGILFIVWVLIITLLIVCVNTLRVKTPMRSYN